MNRWVTLLAIVVIAGVITFGCSKGKDAPTVPVVDTQATPASDSARMGTGTSLLGYYDIYFDIEAGTFEAVANRSAAFTLNIVPFLNMMTDPLYGITFGSIVIYDDDPSILGVDVEFKVHHPFPGIDQYDAYDLLGVIIGNGSETLSYRGLEVPERGTDLWMKNADGYTRWFNPVDFTTELIFGYAPGGYQNLKGDAQLNPYKYYAKGLSKDEDVWQFLNGTNNDGLFTSGSGRTMELEFPMPPVGIGIAFGYAVVVAWEEQGPTGPYTPYHLTEAIAASVNVTPDIWYDSDEGNSGGDLILDADLFAWEIQPSKILIESSVLDGVKEFDAELCGQPLNEHVSTYHVEATTKSLDSGEGHYFWVMAEYTNHDYSNDMPEIPHASGPLAAFFRYDLQILDENPGWIEVLTPNGGEEWAPGTDEEITWDFYNVTGTVFIEYSKDYFVSDINTITTDEANDGSFIWENIPDDYSDTVRVRVSWTDDPSVNDVSDEDFSIVEGGWARTWGVSSYDRGYGVATDGSGNVYVTGTYGGASLRKYSSTGDLQWVTTWGEWGGAGAWGFGVAADGSGNVYVTGYFYGTVDFDPDGGDPHTANGYYDVFLSKFDSSGNFEWARTWGGSSYDSGDGVAVDGSGNVYVTGYFYGTADFDPDGGDPHTANGYDDVFLSKFDSSGNFEWARTWGGSSYDYGNGVAVDGSGNVYVTGRFSGTVDFDPDGGDPHTGNGYYAAFLSKFDSSGNFDWARTWGGSGYDWGEGVAADGSGNVYVTGYFEDTVDFDPGGGDPHTSNGERDVYLSKFDSSGNFDWARTWGGSGYDWGEGVATDGSGNVYVTGYFEDTVDFDPAGGDPRTSNGGEDVFLSKFDSLGNFDWARTWGGSSYDCGEGVAAYGSEYVYVTGYFEVTADFAPTGPPCNEDPDEHTSNGGLDAFLTKYLPDGCW